MVLLARNSVSRAAFLLSAAYLLRVALVFVANAHFFTTS